MELNMKLKLWVPINQRRVATPLKNEDQTFNSSNAVSGYIQKGEAMLRTQSHKNMRKRRGWKTHRQHSGNPHQWTQSWARIINLHFPQISIIFVTMLFVTFKAHVHPCWKLMMTLCAGLSLIVYCQTSLTGGVRRKVGRASGGALCWRFSVKQENKTAIFWT